MPAPVRPRAFQPVVGDGPSRPHVGPVHRSLLADMGAVNASSGREILVRAHHVRITLTLTDSKLAAAAEVGVVGCAAQHVLAGRALGRLFGKGGGAVHCGAPCWGSMMRTAAVRKSEGVHLSAFRKPSAC